MKNENAIIWERVFYPLDIHMTNILENAINLSMPLLAHAKTSVRC